MGSIRTYTNTKCELEIAKARLGWLMDRKEQLYCKYFPITAKLKDDVISGGDKNNDKMDIYLSELYDVDIGTCNSLAAEIELQRAVVDRLNSFSFSPAESPAVASRKMPERIDTRNDYRVATRAFY